MESSWSYDSGDKGFMLSNGAVSPPDFLNTSSKTEFTNWGLKGSSYSYDVNSMMLSSHPNSLENQVSLEVGFTNMIRKQSSHDSLRNCLSSNGSGGGDVINMHTIASNAISDESSSRLSNSLVDSNSKESSLIDLKLGRFGDSTIRTAPPMSSADSSTPAKRVKASSLNSQPAFCQVYGCNKDLGSSKDYHKRHKVCDVHSKTAKVIVNGIEQRFCQQCSRFHLLGEFDDGKRSCRRRLAGHNERRRKPQVRLHSGRAERLLHSYNGFGGTRPNGTTMTATSFICQDILPTSTAASHLEKFGVIDLCKNPKLKDGADFGSKLACSWVDGQFLQKPVCPPYGIVKQCPYSESLNTSTLTASVFNENNYNQYNASCSLFQNNVFDTASTVQGLSELSNKSGCALSLLSSQPQNSSGLPTSSHPLIMPGNGGSHHNFGLLSEVVVSEDPFGVNSLDLSNGDGNANNVVSGFSGGFLHGSEYVNMKDGPSFSGGPTIDLLQLSTQLQRVEHQRQAAVSVKQEDDTFCCLKIT